MTLAPKVQLMTGVPRVCSRMVARLPWIIRRYECLETRAGGATAGNICYDAGHRCACPYVSGNCGADDHHHVRLIMRAGSI